MPETDPAKGGDFMIADVKGRQASQLLDFSSRKITTMFCVKLLPADIRYFASRE